MNVEFEPFDDEEEDELKEGEIRFMEYYSNYTFAYETVNGDVISFKPAFQRKVFEVSLEYWGLSISDIEDILSEDESNLSVVEIDIKEKCEAMRLTIENGEPRLGKFEYLDGGWGYILGEYLEELGYILDFEGESTRFIEAGVYFIK